MKRTLPTKYFGLSVAYIFEMQLKLLALTNLFIAFSLTACLSSPNHTYFRTQYLESTSLGYKPPKQIKMMAVGCGLTLLDAKKTARNNAQFNLRSVMGNERYLESFSEKRRFMRGNQICVQMNAVAK